MAIAVVLVCVSAVWAQQRHHPPEKADVQEEGLLPAPPLNFFQGRPLYRVGGDVKAPQLYESPEPEPLKDFRAARVVLWCIVATDGKPYMIRVAKHDSMEADQKAIATVSKWRWKPAKIKSDDVDVLTTVEVVWR
ncbi:MAG: energy transducer TonB [Terriglobales bacterium]